MAEGEPGPGGPLSPRAGAVRPDARRNRTEAEVMGAFKAAVEVRAGAMQNFVCVERVLFYGSAV